MRFLDDLKKLTKPYDDDDLFDDEEDEMDPEDTEHAAAPEPQPRPVRVGSRSDYSGNGNKVVNIGATSQMKVVLVKPDRFETAAEIADHLREKRAVLMNLEQTNKDISRRLIDFLSGVAYAQDGKIKRVAANTYIITPYNVDLMGDDLMDELETNGVYI
ncbi:MAG: cell division protein SepF [Clostridiales bacterium]|nr:cell division protein SepF [Clostridiales bacterium]